MSLDPLAQDLLRGLMRRYYRDKWPLAQAMWSCAIGYLRLYGKAEEAEKLQAVINSIKVPQ